MMNHVSSGLKALVLSFAALLCGGVWAATPVALFSGETLKAGTVNGITLDLNGNTAADGAITIGSKPVLVSGLSGSDVSVVVTYTGPITATEYALVSAMSSTTYPDLSGIWVDASQIHGLWANSAWTASNAVHKDGTIPSAADKVHRFCFTYGSGSGTYLYLDGKEVYPAGGLKGQNLNPIGLAIGGMRGSAKGAATGLVLSEIAIYNEKVDGSLCAPPVEEIDDADCFGVFTASADGLDKTISLEAVPSLGGAVLRVKNAAELPAGAYTLVDWSGLMGQRNMGYGQPILDLCGADATNFRLIPMVGKVVLLKTDPAQLTQKPYKIWCVGDSITEGYNSTGNCANYRVQLATKLAVAGYNVQFVGQYTHRSKYASGAWAPDEWSWHSGVSGQRMWTRGSVGPNRLAGYVEAIDAAMYQVPNADVICFLLGTNDFGAGDSGEVVFNGWKLIVKKLLARYPNTKIVVSPCIDMHDAGKNNRGAVFKTKMEAALAGTDDTFTAEERARLVNAQLDTYITGSGAPNFEDVYHPTWDGHSKMSDGWYDAIVNNNLISKTVEPAEDIDRSSAKRGAEQNVDASYREGFTKVRTLAIPEEVSYALNETPAYTEDAEAPTTITKVAYYMELVRKDSGEVRYVWADMDAFGDTLEAMLVPTGANVQQKVTTLHVASNMGSITPVAANEKGVEGYLEFSPYTATPAAVDGAPTALWSAMDWNDTLGTSGDGRGSMQVSRIKSEGYNAAELLFAWNNWGAANTGAEGTKAGEIGIGDFPQHYMADHSAGNGIASLINAKYPGSGVGLNDTFVSSDYTTTRFSPWGDTMNAKAYSVRTLEVWVKEAEVVTDPVATIGDKPYATLAAALQDVSGEETTVVSLVKPCAETVTIPANATVVTSTNAAFTGAASGSGRLVCEGYAPATNGALATSLQNAAWTGTLEFKNVSQADFRYDLQLLANTGSTICFNGYTNYPCAPTNSGNVGRDIVAGAWEIGEGGVTFTGGFSNFGFNYVGALKGTGKIKCELTGSNGRNYVRFEGDASEFTGKVEFTSGSTYRIALAATETADGDFTSLAVKTVYIASGVTTSLSDVSNGTVAGAGTLVADGAMPTTAVQNGLKAAAWTGTLWLKNLTTKANYSATLLGNAGSTVRYTNVTGWMTTAMKFDGTVDIVNDENGNGLTINDGSSGWADDKVVRFGCLTGAGTLNLAWAKTYPLHLPDVNGFTGAITCAQANGIGVLIGSEATIEKGGNGKIAVLEGAAATIADGATWTAPNGVVVEGTLVVDGTLQNEVSGSGRLGYAKFNKVHANVMTGLKKAAWTGTLVITGDSAINEGTVDDAAYTSLNEYGTAASKIELAGTCSGYFGLSTKTGSEETPTVVQPELVVSGTWSQNSGYSQAEKSKDYSTIFRKVSGTGTMSSPSGKPNQLYYIEDASDFKGTLEAVSGKFVIGSRVDNSFVANATITVKDGETIAAGLTWKAASGITFGGTADFAAEPSAGDVALTNGAENGTVTLAETAAYTVAGVADTKLALKADGSRIVLALAYPDYVDVDDPKQVADYDVWKTEHAEALASATPLQAKEGYFLNCAPTAEALARAELDFKLTISIGADGTVTVSAPDGYHVKPEIKGAETVNGPYTLPEEDENARFFKAFISL